MKKEEFLVPDRHFMIAELKMASDKKSAEVIKNRSDLLKRLRAEEKQKAQQVINTIPQLTAKAVEENTRTLILYTRKNHPYRKEEEKLAYGLLWSQIPRAANIIIESCRAMGFETVFKNDWQESSITISW